MAMNAEPMVSSRPQPCDSNCKARRSTEACAPNFFLMSSLPADAPLPILATAVVPWTADYKFDAETFRRQVQTIARGLTRHIYIFGTAGEGYAVSDTQF